jgi:hypothetical protein
LSTVSVYVIVAMLLMTVPGAVAPLIVTRKLSDVDAPGAMVPFFPPVAPTPSRKRTRRGATSYCA